MQTITFTGGQIFNGQELLVNHHAVFVDGICTDIFAGEELSLTGLVIDLQGDILSPGYTDLQVNGGGGVLLNDNPCVRNLETIAKAHRSLGTTRLLPTLITDKPEATRAAIDAVKAAVAANMPGIAGLHLEGPHLSVARKGAHDASLIRPMEDDDLQLLLQAVSELPCLMVTVAPENVTLKQVQTLVKAGVLVSLGHSDADYATCVAYHQAGASCVTHLFNAMSQLGSREPGLVGAAIDCGALNIGLIADGIHVHPASIRAAWNASIDEKFYLVSDAMAPAGTDQQSFTLNGRKIYRSNGRLTLSDGTLAGADLDLTTAIRFMHRQVGIDLASALRASITVPNAVLARGSKSVGVTLTASNPVDLPLESMIRIRADLTSVVALRDSLSHS